MRIIGLIGDLPLDTISGWIANNWLVKFFKLNAGISGESIYLFILLDILIMGLVGIMSLALYPAFKKVSKIWSIIAICQPFLGIVIFIITQSAGRSGVLSGVLTISIIMLWSNNFSKITAYIGILAGGAYDQLYFSIRLALAEKILKGKTGFFILDDPFIKSDHKRLAKQMDLLKKISKLGWQIIYFSSK